MNKFLNNIIESEKPLWFYSIINYSSLLVDVMLNCLDGFSLWIEAARRLTHVS